MIISGYEKPIEYGRLLIFDPTMAAMVILAQKQYNDALKDEYERGLKTMDTFYTKYGDFISPFSKDMERYGQMVGDVKSVLDEAYAKGIDLLGSPEGRIIVQRLTNSIDPAEFNRMRTNAKLGFEYLDSVEKAKAKNEFNQNFENWSLQQEGGPGLFSEFSSANGAMWNRPAPYTYQDLNQFTGHIFDKMDDSFLGTGADHYDYYGVSREDRQKALTQHLSGLLSTDLGKYHYQNSKAAYERILGRSLSDQEAMNLWLRDILDSTQEYEHRNRKLNELWKMQQEDASRQRAARIAASGNDDVQAPLPVGVNTALTMDSANKYLLNKSMSVSNYFNSASGIKAADLFKKLTEKLNDKDKDIAVKYMEAKDILNDNSSTSQQRKDANEYIRKASNKKDPNFVAWRKQYDTIANQSIAKWNKENTLEGIAGGKPFESSSDMYKASKDIFDRNYTVSRNSEERALLDKHLPYRVSEDGNYAYMNNDTYFQPIALTKIVQGNNQRHHYKAYNDDKTKTLVKSVADLIKGKKYYEASNDIDRTYGSGMLRGNTKNIINERVVFRISDNPELNEFLNNQKENVLKEYDIEKTSDKNGWLIPITHSQDIDLSYASIDSYSDKDVSGTSNAGNRQVTRLAQVLSHK